MADEAAHRRRFPRYHVDLEITIYRASEPLRSRIQQISRGGCLVFPPLEIDQGTEIRIIFKLAENLPDIRCKGEVVYSVAGQGTGIAFTEIAPRNQDLITEHFDKIAAHGAPSPG